jgi:hypothetical protein
MAEAEYRLFLHNLKNTPMEMTVTINKTDNQKCSVARSDVKYEINSSDEITWNLELPANGSKEIRYKLIIAKS